MAVDNKINNIDDQMLNLFLQRLSLSSGNSASPLETKAQKRAILKSVCEKAGDMERYAYRFFENLLELTDIRDCELSSSNSALRQSLDQALANTDRIFPQSGIIACQGVEGGNSQAACDQLFPRGHLMYVKTFEAVFSAVESGLCQYGVVPIENSNNGSVRAVYDLLQKNNCYIVRSTRLCIRHQLLVKPGTKLEDITEIFSHEQALGQCSQYLSKLKGVTLHPCANTAVAAQMVAESEDKHMAAICAPVCADLYNLEALVSDIQNNDNNYTRFICISKRPEIYTGSNKLSLVLALDNKPGALHDTLSLFSNLGINMTKLESCPVSGTNFEFIFLVDLDASIEDPCVIPMLEQLQRSCRNFHFLGNYSEV